MNKWAGEYLLLPCNLFKKDFHRVVGQMVQGQKAFTQKAFGRQFFGYHAQGTRLEKLD